MFKDSLRLGFKAGSAWRKPRTILAIRRNLFDAPLYFLFTAAVFTSCHGVEGENDLNEIRLGAGTPGALVAKAPVNPNSIFESAVAGWETIAAVDYSQDASWQSGSVIVAQPTPVPVNLNPQQYYSPDDNVKTYIKAWHPSGELNAGIVSFDNDSATLDVLLTTKPVVGSKLDATGKNLTFDHLTTQIRFKVKADESLDSGTTLAYIRIKNAGMPTGINLIDNSLRVSPAGSDGIEVPGIGTQDTIGPNAVSVGKAVMVEPIAGNILRLDVATSGAVFEDVTATINDADFQAGTAYTITLTFLQGGISLSASITPWKEEEGSGIIMY